MKIFLAFLTFCLLFFLINCKNNSDLKQEPFTDSETFFFKLVQSKIDFEEKKMRGDTVQIQEYETRYHLGVQELKERNIFYAQIIKSLLSNEKQIEKRNSIKFMHKEMLSSTIEKCFILSYDVFLNTLLLNIKNLKENEFELVCYK